VFADRQSHGPQPLSTLWMLILSSLLLQPEGTLHEGTETLDHHNRNLLKYIYIYIFCFTRIHVAVWNGIKKLFDHVIVK
jgi:hypothetical protein